MTIASNLREVVRDLQPRRAALPEMATAVLIIDEERDVECVNASAEALFMPVDPIGCALPALFASSGATAATMFLPPWTRAGNPLP